jgi:hypothetical protein
MGLQLSPVGMAAMGASLLAVAGIGIYSGYESVRHSLYYAEADATVTSVETLCAPDVNSPLYTGEMRWAPCGDLAAKSWDEIEQMKYARKAKVSFTYISPADGKQHSGEFDALGRTKFDGARRFGAGMTGKFWASTSAPEEYHYDAWPFAKGG